MPLKLRKLVGNQVAFCYNSITFYTLIKRNIQLSILVMHREKYRGRTVSCQTAPLTDPDARNYRTEIKGLISIEIPFVSPSVRYGS